jgi:integrase
MVALAKRIYNLAVREDMALKNPCWKVAMLKEDNRRDRTLTLGEFERLVGELPEHTIRIAYLAYYTGMRRGEILGLTWERVNMREGFIDLEPRDTKNSERRRLYFNDVLWSIFREVYARKGRSPLFSLAKVGPLKVSGRDLKAH